MNYDPLEIFNTLRHFTIDEFDHPERIKPEVLLMVDELRHREPGIIVTIRTDYRPGDPLTHGAGQALDFVIRDRNTREPLPIRKQFLIMIRYAWTGIGIYPYWNSPGVHGDLKPMSLYSRRRYWMRNKKGVYVAIDPFITLTL